ncbi:type II toxin-antitoxin system PemK/MazF family toxin, partial [Lactobacillus reuteri]|nr:type II toxin-antitoxin system PemK/MazF family toxin [Limosilactobacillus reuteri]
VVLWQLQNFDYHARNGVIVNHLSEKMIKQLQQYVNDMVGNE